MLTAGEFDWPDGWEDAIPALTRVVLSVCYRRGLSAADADDALQLVLMRITVEAAVRKRHFPTVPELCGWAKKYLLSQLGKQTRRLALLGTPSGIDVATLPDEPDEIAAQEPIGSYLALVEDAREREVLSFRYVDGLKFREAAERLGVSTSLVQKLHDRALEKLRRRLAV